MDADTPSAPVVLRALRDEFEPIAPHFRQLAADLAKALATERSKATALYCSVDWWGGSVGTNHPPGFFAPNVIGTGQSNGCTARTQGKALALRCGYTRISCRAGAYQQANGGRR